MKFIKKKFFFYFIWFSLWDKYLIGSEDQFYLYSLEHIETPLKINSKDSTKEQLIKRIILNDNQIKFPIVFFLDPIVINFILFFLLNGKIFNKEEDQTNYKKKNIIITILLISNLLLYIIFLIPQIIQLIFITINFIWKNIYSIIIFIFILFTKEFFDIFIQISEDTMSRKWLHALLKVFELVILIYDKIVKTISDIFSGTKSFIKIFIKNESKLLALLLLLVFINGILYISYKFSSKHHVIIKIIIFFVFLSYFISDIFKNTTVDGSMNPISNVSFMNVFSLLNTIINNILRFIKILAIIILKKIFILNDDFYTSHNIHFQIVNIYMSMTLFYILYLFCYKFLLNQYKSIYYKILIQVLIAIMFFINENQLVKNSLSKPIQLYYIFFNLLLLLLNNNLFYNKIFIKFTNEFITYNLNYNFFYEYFLYFFFIKDCLKLLHRDGVQNYQQYHILVEIVFNLMFFILNNINTITILANYYKIFHHMFQENTFNNLKLFLTNDSIKKQSLYFAINYLMMEIIVLIMDILKFNINIINLNQFKVVQPYNLTLLEKQKFNFNTLLIIFYFYHPILENIFIKEMIANNMYIQNYSQILQHKFPLEKNQKKIKKILNYVTELQYFYTKEHLLLFDEMFDIKNV